MESHCVGPQTPVSCVCVGGQGGRDPTLGGQRGPALAPPSARGATGGLLPWPCQPSSFLLDAPCILELQLLLRFCHPHQEIQVDPTPEVPLTSVLFLFLFVFKLTCKLACYMPAIVQISLQIECTEYLF